MSVNQARHGVATMCRVLGVSPSGYYAWRGRGPSRRARRDEELRGMIGRIHEDSRATYGMPRVHAELVAGGCRVGRKRVARLMRESGLAGVSRRRGTRTTRGDRRQRAAPDRVQRQFRADAPNRTWVADITYVPTWTGFVYLAIVLDVFSRKVVGWAIADHLRTELVLADLKMPGALEAVDAILSEADSGTVSTAEAIEQLLSAQIVLRNNRRLQTAMRASRLPAVKTLEQFDFAFQPSIKREQIENLHELGFLDRAENVILLGPPGVGRTHLAISLAIAAAQSGRRVYYGTLAGLIESLTEAKAAGNLSRRLRVLTHPALLVVDEIGYLPVSQDGAVLFFQLINARHERASTVLQQGLRGMGQRAQRRGDGRRPDRPPRAPLPHRQHPRQQLPLQRNLGEELRRLDERVKAFGVQIVRISREIPACQRLEAIPGIGPLSSTALLAAVGEAREFRSGRELAAWLGIVPRQRSTGGRSRLLGISKRGDRYLRYLLIHGARSALRTAKRRSDRRSQWATEVEKRRGTNIAAVALANKNARTVWAVLTQESSFDADYHSRVA